MIDTSLAEPEQHYCDLPKIEEWEFTEESTDWSTPTRVKFLPPGTRNFCEACGAVYVVTYIPGGYSAYTAWSARYEWRRETRRQALVRRWKARK